MVIYNYGKVNTSSKEKIKEKIEKYENTNNIMGFFCPHCGCKEMIYYGSYVRNVIEINDERLEMTITIKRVQCCECKKVHAVIPSFLIPYMQHTVETVNEVLKDKIVDRKSTSEVEEETGVSRQLQRKWQLKIENIKGKLETLFLIFVFEKVMLEIRKEEKMIEKYYCEYKEIYMFRRKGTVYNLLPT